MRTVHARTEVGPLKIERPPPGLVVKYADGSEHVSIDGRGMVRVKPVIINRQFISTEPCPRCEYVATHRFSQPIGPSIVYRSCAVCDLVWWEQ